MHVNRKHKDHTSVEAVVDAETSVGKDKFCGWVNAAYTKVVETSLYSATVKSSNVLDYSQFSHLHTYVQSINLNNSEKFYSSYYTEVVLNSQKYFPHLSEISSKIVSMKLADILLIKNKKGSLPLELTTKNLNEKELAGLQCLGGYVLQKIFLKLKRSKNYKSDEYQQAMSILSAGRSNIPNPNVKLVNALNRGGLWVIDDKVQKIFVIAEKYFCLQTGHFGLTHIDIPNIVETLMQFTYVKEFFQELVATASIKPSIDVAKNLLHSILVLYVKVRAFSFAKDVIEKHKYIKKQTKAKGLRTAIKQASSDQGSSDRW